MLDFNPKKTNCTGCSACYSACPVRCIKMIEDEEGFLYPIADYNSCIHCGLCEKVCPMIHKDYSESKSLTQCAFAATSKSKDIWRRSASGGAFSEICRTWGDSETMVVGATMEFPIIHHIAVIGVDNIAPLCKSKYVSSALENVFQQIKLHLSKNKRAIFCGCPCQVDGLKNYLRRDYDNLLTIDLICHGQGSPAVFNECMNVISEDLKESVISYEFRHKGVIFDSEYISEIKTQKNKYLSKQDPYISLFLSQNCLRPCCGSHCKYRNSNRVGDITLADCKGLYEIFPDLAGVKHNYSTIVTNTEKGHLAVCALSTVMNIREATLDSVKEYNPLFYRQTKASEHRDDFFADFHTDPNSAIRKWGKKFARYTPSLKHLAFMYSPVILRRLALKFRKNH